MPARDEREEAREEARRSLYEVMELAAAYFEAALAHNIGARARGYLFERGVTRRGADALPRRLCARQPQWPQGAPRGATACRRRT